MNVLVFLIPASLTLGGLGLLAFIWTLRADQYDDLEGEAHRILIDGDTPPTDMPPADSAKSEPPQI